MSDQAAATVAALALLGLGLAAVAGWLAYAQYLRWRARRLEARKGVTRALLDALGARERRLLEPELASLSTLRDLEALEAVLEEQALAGGDRPPWLLDAYDRLGLVDRLVDRLEHAGSWRRRFLAAEVLGRVGSGRAVPALLRTATATTREDGDVREAALRALARIADPAAVPLLAEALRRAEGWLAPRLADILVRSREAAVDPMLAILADPTPHPSRAWATQVLGEVRASRAFHPLVAALGDPDDEVRAKAATALGQLGDRRAVPHLLERLLADPAPFVRARIAGTLGQLGDPAVIDRLVRALGDPAWWVRMRAIEALEQLGDVAEPPLLAALDDADPEIRIRAAVGLERLGLPDRIVAAIAGGTADADALTTFDKLAAAGARELLAELLQHPADAVRRLALEAVARHGRRELAATVAGRARGDGVPAVREAALAVLATLGGPDAPITARAALDDPAAEVRVAAARLLAHAGDAGAAPALGRALQDPDPRVRAAAVAAVGALRHADAVHEVLALLHDVDPAVRAAAATAAGEAGLGVLAPDLTTLLGDPDDDVRRAAVVAIGRVGDRGAYRALMRAFRSSGDALRPAIVEAALRMDEHAVWDVMDLLLDQADTAAKLGVVAQLRGAASAPVGVALEALWRDRDPVVRAAVIDAIGAVGSPRALERVTEALADPDLEVRARGADAAVRRQCGELGPALTALLHDDPAPAVRERAALAVALLGVRGAGDHLAQALRQDTAPIARAAALLGLGLFTDDSLVERVVGLPDGERVRDVLVERIRHDPEYRLLARRLRGARDLELRALGLDSREAMERSLAEGLRSALDAQQRLRLVAGLRALPGGRTRDLLRRTVAGDPDPAVRAAALEAVAGQLDETERIAELRRALGDPSLVVRRAAVGLFGGVPADRALPVLFDSLRADDDPSVVAAVAAQAEAAFEAFVDLCLGLALDGEETLLVTRVARHLHHPQLARVLRPIAGSSSPRARAALAGLWADRPDLADAAALARLAVDPVVAVRLAAIAAAGATRAWALLAERAEDPDPAAREAAAVALLGAPPRTQPAERALVRLTHDAAEPVRAAAAAVLLLRGGEVGLEALPRQPVAQALARLADVAALRTRAGTSPDAARRRVAAVALALLDDPEARRIADADPSPEVRDAVRAALAGAAA